MPYGSEVQLAEIVRTIVASGHRSFLNVFKRMGQGNPAPLSWPHPGSCSASTSRLTDGLGRFCADLDARVLDAGGRLYFAKDAVSIAETVHRIYPRLSEWRQVRDAVDPEGIFVSDMARRLRLLDEELRFGRPVPSQVPT